MQTFTQTTAGAQTVQFNITGKYFTILATNNGLDVRFYNGGKLKELGTIAGLMAGLEVSFNLDGDNFDRVEIDTLGADTFTIGIGNGQARYNRSQGNVAITNTPAVTISGNSASNPLFTSYLISSYGTSYKSTAAVAANGQEVIFTPASNVNGAIIHALSFATIVTGNSAVEGFLAKNAAPANPTDGDAILSQTAISGNYYSGVLPCPVKIPAGKGLYYVNGTLAHVSSNRTALYTLL